MHSGSCRPGTSCCIVACLVGIISVARSSTGIVLGLDVVVPSLCSVEISFASRTGSELDWSTIRWPEAAIEASAAYLGRAEGFSYMPRPAPTNATISAAIRLVHDLTSHMFSC